MNKRASPAGLHRRELRHGEVPGGERGRRGPAGQRGLDAPPRSGLLRPPQHRRVSPGGQQGQCGPASPGGRGGGQPSRQGRCLRAPSGKTVADRRGVVTRWSPSGGFQPDGPGLHRDTASAGRRLGRAPQGAGLREAGGQAPAQVGLQGHGRSRKGGRRKGGAFRPDEGTGLSRERQGAVEGSAPCRPGCSKPHSISGPLCVIGFPSLQGVGAGCPRGPWVGTQSQEPGTWGSRADGLVLSTVSAGGAAWNRGVFPWADEGGAAGGEACAVRPAGETGGGGPAAPGPCAKAAHV